MAYLPPYSALKAGIGVSPGGDLVVMSREMFRMFVAALATAAAFDAAWYRREYPDVEAAIDQGDLEGELDHFATFGYEEGRMPARMVVEETWYRDAYPDVDAAIRDGVLASAEDHYNDIGHIEGRAPDAASQNEIRRWQEAIDRSQDLARAQAPALSAWQEEPEIGAQI
jgi:hypothetical protein